MKFNKYNDIKIKFKLKLLKGFTVVRERSSGDRNIPFYKLVYIIYCNTILTCVISIINS